MDDICRIISKFPEAKQNVHIHLVEVSPALKKVQHQTLGCDVSSQLSKYGFPVTWHGDLDEISSNGGFSIYLAHEFLDALPIHKFKRDADGNWREILIDCKRSGANSYQLNYVLSRHATPASKAFVPAQIESDQFEYCPDAMLLLNRLAKRLNQNPGLFLACDYGFSRQVDQLASISRDTFRSFKNHQQWDPLMEPGTADLTADVDFDAIKTLVQDKVTCFGPITQKQFLLCLGAHIRLVHLMKQTPDDQTRANLQSGVKMLLHDMGSKFKFFAMFPKSFSNLFENDPPAAFHEMKQ